MVWERATSIEGVNAELRPLLRMTRPRGLTGSSIAALRPGTPAGRSWLLAGGLVPIDFDDLCLVEIEPPRRFLESSSMLSMSSWSHERIVEPIDDAGSSVIDAIRFELRPGLRRVPGLRAGVTEAIRFLFRHRHSRLAELHGRHQSR